MGVFVLVAQALWVLVVHRDRLRELLVVHGLVVLGFLPWIPSFLVQLANSGDESRRIATLTPPSLRYWAEIDVRMLLAGAPMRPPLWAHGRRPGASVFVVFALGGIFAPLQHIGERAGPGNAFGRVADARFPGLETVLVGKYQLRGR